MTPSFDEQQRRIQGDDQQGAEDQATHVDERPPDSVTERRQLQHALRDPLNGARLHLTLIQTILEQTPHPNADVLQAVRTADLEIDRAAQVLKEYSEKSSRSRPTRVSVRALCSRVVQLAASAYDRDLDIDLLTDSNADELEVELDLSRMKRVVLDLLHSAIESALREGGKVLVSLRREGHDAVIEVQHRDSASELFEAGKGFDDTDTLAADLSTAFQIVAEQGGSLEVDSDAQRTTFHLRLPAVTAIRHQIP